MRSFPLADSTFLHGANLTPGGLGRWLNMLAEQSADQTNATLHVHVHVHGTAGNDANDGLSAENAKATIAAADLLLPVVLGANCAMHLRGVNTLTSSVFLLSRTLMRNVSLVIDGGPDVDVVAPVGGGVYTADIASTTSIGASTAGWTAGAYNGYFVEILTGPAAGQTRMIRQDHTTTTITPTRNYSVSPGAGATFRIVKPATRITAASALNFGIVGNDGYGFVRLQRVTIDDNCYTQIRANFAAVFLSHVVIDAPNAAAVVINGCRGSSTQAVGEKMDPTTFVSDSGNTKPSVGLGVRGADGVRVLDSVVRFSSSYLSHLQISNSQGAVLAGSGVRRITAWNTQSPDQASNPFLASSSGYAATKISGSASDGLLAIGSELTISGAVDFSDNAGHGIQSIRSLVQFVSTRPTGSNNAKAGVYARQGTSLLLAAGQTPTINGNGIDLAVDSPTIQASTWAAIIAGTPVASTAQVTTAMVF